MSLIIDSVAKRFGRFPALAGASLTAPQGACVALLALLTLAVKSLLEWRYADELAAVHRH